MKLRMIKITSALLALILLLSLASCSVVSIGEKPTQQNTLTYTDVSEEGSGQPSEENTTAGGDDPIPLPPTGVRTLQFVALNDLHGYIDRDDAGIGGLSNTAEAIDRLSKYYGDDDEKTTTRDDIVLFANGDMLQGTAVSNMSRGAAVLEAMNEMGFDGMGIGNHEFDWGLETILRYWDGDESNGESNFPLVTSNISNRSDGTLIANVSDADRVYPWVIVDKEGVSVGLISAIGPCENSISRIRVEPYQFGEVVSSVRNAALELKAAGADLISVNIHYGNASGIAEYAANASIASLKGEDGEYLVDVIFNGHTHTRQKGVIPRNDGASVPVIQGGCNNKSFSAVEIRYDPETDTVVSHQSDVKDVASVGTNHNVRVQAVIDGYNADLIHSLPTLAVSGVTVNSKYQLYSYMGDVMVKALGADYSVGNNGGLRGTGGITARNPITEANVYEIIPFDNEMILVTIKGDALYDFYQKEEGFAYFGAAKNSPPISSLQGSQEYYTLAIIDYLYTGPYFNYSNAIAKVEHTQVYQRDLLIIDIKICGDMGVAWNPGSGARIPKQEW